MKKIIIPTLILMLFSCSEFKLPSIIRSVDIADEPEVVTNESDVSITESEDIIEDLQDSEEKSYTLDITDYNPRFESIKHNFTRDDKLAVVGSSVAKYYPFVELNSQDDLSQLGEGSALKVGTILKISDAIEIKDSIYDNFFRFEKDNNYFYKTEIDSEEVLVWGADLIMVDSGTEAVKVAGYYSPDTESEFYRSYNGPYDLTSKDKRELEKSRLTKNLVNKNSSMIDLYLNDSKRRDVAMFITGDYIFHSTNSLINEVKEDYFSSSIEPDLVKFIDSVISELERYLGEDNGKNPNYSKKLERVYKYFLVAKVLINHVDDKVLMEEHLRSMPGAVIDEYYRILAGEFRESLILDQEIHYGEIDGAGEGNSLYLTLEWLSLPLSEFQNSLDKTRFSLIVMNVISSSDELYKLWQKLNRGIRYLSLSHETIDIEDLIVMLADLEINIFPYWSEVSENLQSVNSLVEGHFSIFSQGKRVDQRVSAYLNKDRGNATPLDFIALMGSRSAHSLIRQSEEEFSYWSNYRERYNELESYISSLDDEFWNQSIYTELLESLKPLSSFEQKREFYFMEKGKWNQKVLLSSIGAWVEIISTESNTSNKQGITSKINTTDLSYRVDDIPLQYHYVEPNLTLYTNLLSIIESLYTITENRSLEEYKKILETVIEVIKKEIEGSPVSEDENIYLSKIPSVIAKLLGSRTYSSTADILDGSLESGSYKVSTDVPYRWTITLDDDRYGKRLLTGYGYSVKEEVEVPFWISQVP